MEPPSDISPDKLDRMHEGEREEKKGHVIRVRCASHLYTSSFEEERGLPHILEILGGVRRALMKKQASKQANLE